MGCVASRIENEENVRRCKERKRLMKQLQGLRGEFAAAQMAYLRALRNAGATLRQFTEPETLELQDAHYRLPDPSSPLPPLPPPPPPPSFSPDLRRIINDGRTGELLKECFDINEENKYKMPPPAVHSSAWDFWDPFDPSVPVHQKKRSINQEDEDEEWVDTNTEFEEEKEGVVKEIVLRTLREKSPARELMDDTSSMASWNTKDTDMPVVVSGSTKTLAGIVKELDDYFLKASEGVKEIAVLMETNEQRQLHESIGESKRKQSKSAKVFSALSWNWSSKSLHSGGDLTEFHASGEACKPGAHCATLKKLCSEEQKLYEKLKEEGVALLHYEKQTSLLEKLEAQGQDSPKAEKIRSSVEALQSEISFLQHRINSICSSIVKLRDEEMHPQLIELASGLMQMWRTMYDSHLVQGHISHQMNIVSNDPSNEPTSDYHIQATLQLEAEVTSWYNSFCNLLKSQSEYVRTLNQWVQLTRSLANSQPSEVLSGSHALCEEWQVALERLPDKVAAEALKNFVSVIHSIVLQHMEEKKLQKKSEKLQRRLDRELSLLRKLEKTWSENTSNNQSSGPSPNHPVSVKRAKTEGLKKKLEVEKARYLNCIQLSHAMTLNNLNMCLPSVFQALTGFSSVCAQAFEAIYGLAKATDCQDGSLQSEPIQT